MIAGKPFLPVRPVFARVRMQGRVFVQTHRRAVHPVQFIRPHRWRKCLAPFVNGHSVSGRKDSARQVCIVELVFLVEKRGRRPVPRHTKCADRIPHTKVFDRQIDTKPRLCFLPPVPFRLTGRCERRKVTAPFETCRIIRLGIARPRPVALDRLANAAYIFARRDPARAQQACQRPRRVGAPRETENENLVPRLITKDQGAVGVFDVLDQTPAHRTTSKAVKRACHNVRPPPCPYAQHVKHLLFAPVVGGMFDRLRQLHHIRWIDRIVAVPRSITKNRNPFHSKVLF